MIAASFLKVRKLTLVLGAFLLVLVALLLFSRSTIFAEDPSTLTGCLKVNTGILYDVAESSDPLNPCRTGDSEVALNTTGTITRIITANMAGWNSDTVMSLGGGIRTLHNVAGTGVRYTFAIPFDYAGGDLRVREWFYVNSAGTAKMTTEILKVSSAGTETLVQSATSDDLVYGSSGRTVRVSTIDEADVDPGDLFLVGLTRDGTNGSDTMGLMDILGVAVEYSANQ